MTIRMNAALRRRLAGLALGGLIACAAVPAVAQWLPPWRAVVSTGDIAERLEAQGYLLVAPLQWRPGIYLADVRAGPGGLQRLVIDDRSGEILERFMSPPRRFGPEFAVRYDEAAPPPPGVVQVPPGPRIPVPPNSAPAAKSAYGGATDVHIPSAISPYGPQSAPASTTARPKPGASARKTPGAKTTPSVPPTVAPPLPPPAPPREAKDPNESAPTPNPEPKIESSPGETDNASAASAGGAPETAWIDPRPEAREQSTGSPADMTANTAVSPSAEEASGKSKVSIVPAAVSE